MSGAPLFAGVELGGTKTIAVVARGGAIIDQLRVATTTPLETLGAIADRLATWRPAALGIASFGPVAINRDDPRFGHILATPKPGWEGTDLIAALACRVPVALTTDVIAAALAEGRYGAAAGLTDFVYVTIGTGIGMGIVSGGSPLTGRLHPEAGHMFVPRLPGDAFPGVCRFHRDCLEGLASGPAIEQRAGTEGRAIADDDPAWRFVVDALAHAFANLRLTLACEAIVIGGGVSVARPWLADAIAARMDDLLAGYLPTPSIVLPAALGAEAGPRGALLLAEAALG
ncbi:MAG: ROK family protein [Sphingomonas bacterium]|nr:ROK family protein [Sphingomonas bacterium]